MAANVLPVEHLIETDSDGVDVYFLTIRLSPDDLWSHVKRATQNSFGRIVIAKQLGKSKVSNLDLAVMQQNVRQFKIPMHDLVLNKGFEAIQNLAQDLKCLIFCQELFLLHILVQITLVAILDH